MEGFGNKLIAKIVIGAVFMWILANSVDGFSIEGFLPILVFSFLYIVLGFLMKLILQPLLMPAHLLTFGLSYFAVNAGIFMLLVNLTNNMFGSTVVSVDGFISAFILALVYTFIGWVI